MVGSIVGDEMHQKGMGIYKFLPYKEYYSKRIGHSIQMGIILVM